MDNHSQRELLLVFSGPLNHHFPVDAGVPLEIKLRLERLRLEELLREARRQTLCGGEREMLERAC
jgi:hypothetical protein